MSIDATQYLESLLKVKGLLPLKSRADYLKDHKNERGFTFKDIELSLRRFISSR
jgi:hypothetical protein